MHRSDLFDLQIVGSDQGANEQDTENAETPSKRCKEEEVVNYGEEDISYGKRHLRCVEFLVDG